MQLILGKKFPPTHILKADFFVVEMITTIIPFPYFYIAIPVTDVIYFNQTFKNQWATLWIVYFPISHFCGSAG